GGLMDGASSTVAASLPAAAAAATGPSAAAATEEAAIATLLQPTFADNVAALRAAADGAGRTVDAGLVITAATVIRSAAIRASTATDSLEMPNAATVVEDTHTAATEEPEPCLCCGKALSFKRSVTVSPCGHVLHRSCLLRRIDEAMEFYADTKLLPTCDCGAMAQYFSHTHATERVGYWGMREELIINGKSKWPV
ncbi:hypothetical protein PENTCL1PPCAC_29786, partial [Pristionchus entomophagus]